VATEPVRLLTRPGCHLCDLVRQPVAEICALVGVPLLEVAIDQDPGLCATYTARVPVLLWRGEVLAEGRFDPALLARRLGPGAAAGGRVGTIR